MNGLYEMYYDEYMKSKSKSDPDEWIARRFITEGKCDINNASEVVPIMSELMRRDEVKLIDAIKKTYLSQE